ncbi:MAG: SDR family oxidoreductase [Nannocystaceae bacterium]
MNFFVTGGSRGIGAAIVAAAAAEGHGVAFAYQRTVEAANGLCARVTEAHPDGRCVPFRMDVTDSQTVERVGDAILEAFGSIDVVVNCAGVSRDNLVVSMSDDEWNEVIAANLTGPFFVARQFLPNMLANRFGRIVNISSVQHGGARGQANYAASKAGLHGLTFSLAKEYGRKGVTANAVAPGFFDTDMTRETLPAGAREYWRAHCPAPKGRMGVVDEVAAAVLFLASERAGFINGEVIHVAGGLNWLP